MITKKSKVVIQGEGYVEVKETEDPSPIWDGERTVMATVVKHSEVRTVSVVLANSVEIHCYEEQVFPVRLKLDPEILYIKAKDLTSNHFVHLSENLYEFDYLDLSCYKYLSKLNSEQVGVLAGLFYTLTDNPRLTDITWSRKESWKELESLLSTMQVSFEKEVYFKRADRIKYSIENEEFLSEIQDFIPVDSIPEFFWKSKLLWKGFLKSVFTSCVVGKEMFTIRSSKESSILTEIQQALLLFGINSSWSRGLKASQLIVFKNNCYRLAYSIGVFNAENLFGGVDFKRFLKYKDKTMFDMRYSRVRGVKQCENVEVFEITSEQFMTNGVILNNYDRRRQ